MTDPVILLDMDGVLSDFASAVSRVSPDPHYVYNSFEAKLMFGEKDPALLEEEFGFDSVNEMWRAIDSRGIEFWSEMPTYPWAKHLVETLSGFDAKLVVCTAPSLSENSAAGKVVWLQRFFNSRNFRDYMLTPAKWAAASENTFLIDDSESNIEKFRRRRGGAALWPAPWNSLHSRYSDNGIKQLEYVLEPLKKWYDDITADTRADMIHG